MRTPHHPLMALVCSLLGALHFGCFAAAEQPASADLTLMAGRRASTEHLWLQETLVNHVAPRNNTYDKDPSFITWAGVNGATEYSNRTVCSTFLTLTLQQARGWTSDDIVAWLGAPRPTAAHYHDAIVSKDRFSLVTRIHNIAPGDIIAIRYPEKETATGHVATAASVAKARVPTEPIVAGTSQFELTIIDSSHSGHGPTDTRRKPDGSWHTGAGRGVMRLYGDAQDRLVGYTWSTFSVSAFYPQSKRHLVVGRLR